VLLNQADGRITAAVVMGIKQVPLSEAETLLEQHGNRLREIL
jgi:N-acetylmuramic acid 6-phosphate (MurNAc-6-P) etherase